MLPIDPSQQHYDQKRVTIPGETTRRIDVVFSPEWWYMVPTTALPDPVYVSPAVELDVISVGIPIQGSNPSTITGIRGSRSLYIYNSGAADVIFSIAYGKGLPAPVTSTPTVISSSGASGVWQIITDGANISWDLSLGNGEVTLGGNRAMTAPANQEAGQQYYLLIKQDATGNRTITSWASDYKFAGGAPPILSYLPDACDLLEFFCDGDGYMHLQKITKDTLNTFDPLSLASCWAWLKADSVTGLSDGDKLAVWEDQSGNGNDFDQVTSGLRPLWRSNIKNGNPAIQFVRASTNYLSCTSSFPTSRTLIIAYMVTAAGLGGNYRIFSNYASSENAIWNNYSYTPTITGITGVADKWVVVTVQHGSDAYLWNNGVYQGTNTANAQGGTNIRIATRANVAGSYCVDGYIAEILIYDVELTDTQRNQVEAYLNGKYSIY